MIRVFFGSVILSVIHRVGCISEAEEFLIRHIITKNDTFNWLKSLNPRNSSSPYCDVCCVELSKNIVGKTCGTHTMCVYPNDTIGPSCRGYIHVHFTAGEKSAILDIHNSMRNKVANGLEEDGDPGPQPPASNMRLMAWNDELSQIAQRWIAQCIFSHDLCRDTPSFPVGQNLGRGNLAKDNELSLILQWYDEVGKFNSSEVDSFKLYTGYDAHVNSKDHLSGRYTQLVWADSNMLGCARAIFQHTSALRLYYVEHLVCNYGPTGNIPDQPVYRVGRPCSNCPDGLVCSLEYNGLCDTGEKLDLVADVRSGDCTRHKFDWILLVSVRFMYSLF